jgi:hypothetical protein
MHRWVWDLHYPAPDALQYEYPISAVPHKTPRSPQGATALPGEYKVRITAGGRSAEAPLTVKMDPRVKVPVSALQEQFEEATRLAAALSHSTRAVREAQAAQRQLKQLSSKASGPLAEAVKSLSDRVTHVLEKPAETDAAHQMEPTLSRVNDQVSTLYGMITQVDAAPTRAQAHAAAAAEEDSSTVLARWDEIKKTDIPALNTQLKQANLSEIRLDVKAQNEDAEEQD